MSNGKHGNLQNRTKQFALDIIRYCAALPQQREVGIITQQLIRSASSVGANYRSACRARSRADFIAKMSIVEEETDEAMYWLDLLNSLGVAQEGEMQRLRDEADQLLAITVASKKTARLNSGMHTLTRHSTFDTRH